MARVSLRDPDPATRTRAVPNQLLILTGELEAAQLGTALQSAAPPDIEVTAISTGSQLAECGERDLAAARLISFCTGVIVPPAILDALTLEPYNIHPGSPEYPGLYPEAFAVYDGARRFAATAHVMAHIVDTGPIVGADWFDVPRGWRREQLAERAYQAALGLFFDITLRCVASDAPLPRIAETWSGRRRTRVDYRSMCTPTGSATEDDRRRRAFEPDFPGAAGEVTIR